MVRARDVRGIRVLGGGLFRFAYPTDRLLRYRDAVKAAHIPSVRRRIMERIAKRVGASPSDWFAAMADVPIKSLPVDYYDGTRWRAISPGTLHSVALEEWQHLSQVLDLIARREFASLPESVRSSIHVT